MQERLSVLLVDDDEDDYRLTADLLSDIQHTRLLLDWASTFETGAAQMQRGVHDVFLIDYRLGKHDGLELLAQFASSKVPIIMLTSEQDRSIDLKATQLGAMDYLIKGQINSEMLERSIRYSIACKRTEEQLREVKEGLAEIVELRTDELVRANAELRVNEQRLRFLSEASRVLGSSLDFQTTLKNMAGFAASAFADTWCLIDIVKDDRIERLEAAYSAVDVNQLANKLRESVMDLQSENPIAITIRTCEAVVLDSNDADSAQKIRRAFPIAGEDNFKCLMSLPLIGHSRCLGSMSFVSAVRDCHFDEDLQFARQLADRSALALENARLYTELQRSNRLKDEFLTTISHELRTPMTAIVGWAELLQKGALKKNRVQDAIATIARNASAQTRLVDDLLDVSAIITGKLKLDVQPLYPAFAVQNAIDSIQPAANAKGIRVEAVLDSSAGPIAADVDRIQQVAWNLLSNAVKFTRNNGRVQVTLEKSNSGVELRVADSGVGISEDFLPHVFDRFTQADASSTRGYGGMGIGLAIVRHLVELHGGGVEATSAGKDQGATFIVRLPLAGSHQEPDRTTDRTASPADGSVRFSPADLSGLRILVVDDDPETKKLVQAILQMAGAEVTAVTSAEEALEILISVRPEILISDISMPLKDGYALIRDVRKLGMPHCHIPALALTAFAREEDRKRALGAGFDAHLAKPISSESLIAAVTNLTERDNRQLRRG